MDKENIKETGKIDYIKIIVENGLILSVFYILLFINSFFYRYGKLYYYRLHSQFVKVDLFYDIPELFVSTLTIAAIFSVVFFVRYTTREQLGIIDKFNRVKKVQKNRRF